MTALLLQTALLLLGAYFLGAFTGCLVRRTFFATALAEPVLPESSHAPVPPRRLPDPEPILVPAAASSRFERALSGESVVAEQDFQGETPVSQPYISPEPPVVAPPRAAPAAAVPWAPAAPPASPEPPKPAAQAPSSIADQPQPQGEDRGFARPAASARSIGTSAAAAAALAAATARHQASKAAAAKDDGGPRSSAGPNTLEVSSASAPVAPAPSVAPPPPSTAAAPAAAAPVTPDDFTRIRGIDKELQAGLAKLGIHRFAEIAAWRKPDILRISEALGLRRGRIAQENWIEQAQILMGGKDTAFSRRRHGAPPLAKPSADQGERRASTDKQRLGAAASGMAAAVAASVAAAPRRPVLALGRDNLQRISRISEDVERLLNVQGVSRYHQIANWTSADVTRFDRLLGGERRISRENWIEQAQILAPGGETAYAREFDKLHAAAAPAGPRPTQLAEAIRTASQGTGRKVDLSKLRSVRSEAFHSGDGGQAAAGATAPLADDLKRIRGVGVLIEKRLNNLGYRTYAQVANWTAADVDRISKALDFGGRIERENWVEQARILASGGQTEFARRVDRGEVETSRSRP